jgi:hypothetical protein
MDILTKFDGSGKKICPFCMEELHLYGSFDLKLSNNHYMDKHLKIMLDKENINLMFRISFEDITIQHWKSSNNTITVSTKSDTIYLPIFNVFDYSIEELKSKINIYLLFS